jgi:hypothetical protein
MVSTAQLDQGVVLTWQEDYETIEGYDFGGYQFQGYNIYQGASVAGPWTRLATFDVVDDYGIIFDQTFDAETGLVLEKPVQWGENSGLQRYIIVDEDAIASGPLNNYRKYYFAVTSYAFNEDPAVAPRTVESATNALEIYPQELFDQSPVAELAEMLDVTHTGVPLSDGTVEVTVLDPSVLTGHDYEVTFFEETHIEDDHEVTETFWKVTDTNTGVDVVPKWSNQSDNQDHPIVDGMLIRATGPPAGIKAIVQVANADGFLVDQDGWPDDLSDAAGEPFGGNNVWHSLSSPTDEHRFYISAGGGGGTIDRMARSIQNANAHDFEMRFTEAGGIYIWWYDDDTWQEVPI